MAFCVLSATSSWLVARKGLPSYSTASTNDSTSFQNLTCKLCPSSWRAVDDDGGWRTASNSSTIRAESGPASMISERVRVRPLRHAPRSFCWTVHGLGSWPWGCTFYLTSEQEICPPWIRHIFQDVSRLAGPCHVHVPAANTRSSSSLWRETSRSVRHMFAHLVRSPLPAGTAQREPTAAPARLRLTRTWTGVQFGNVNSTYRITHVGPFHSRKTTSRRSAWAGTATWGRLDGHISCTWCDAH